jgi:hypothetical protein
MDRGANLIVKEAGDIYCRAKATRPEIVEDI